MKIAFATNFCWPTVGGCQSIVHGLAENLHKKFGYECVVYGKSYTDKPTIRNGVCVAPVSSNGVKFVQEISAGEYDWLIVYEDVFVHWSSILNCIDNLKCKIAVVLGGARGILANPSILQKIQKYKNKIKIITHLEGYLDSLMCKYYNIPYTVIPAFVDTEEFDNSIKNDNWNFRDKYGFGKEKLVLCVSNFFPGKGQSYLKDICCKMEGLKEKFSLVFVCSTTNIPIINKYQNDFKCSLSKLPFKAVMLEDLSRNEVVKAFCDSDVFAFPSQQETFGLVLLEAMAARKPWISLPVGVSPSLVGGVVVDALIKNERNDYVYTAEVAESFQRNLEKLIIGNHEKMVFDDSGRRLVDMKYSLNSVLLHYRELLEETCNDKFIN